MSTTKKYTWHPERDGFGTVLGMKGQYYFGEGYPVEAMGVTYERAVELFGDVDQCELPIPITIDIPDNFKEAPK